jgi:GT2 family glycosyltransferase
MSSSKLRMLPFVGLLLPLDLLVACIVIASAFVSIPLRLFRRREARVIGPVDLSFVTIQILNWDGLHLLEESLPALMEAVRRHSDRSGAKHEVVVVDNGSQDGSVEFLRRNFPEVRVVALDRNYGFSLGNNKGLEHVRSDIVLFLNNDMAVAPDFLQPLLEPFADPGVFAVASQVYFSNPEQRREETGKTRGEFEKGFFRFWHDNVALDDENGPASPIFWAGGGSCAVDVRKLRFLGGFDTLYHPFYVEDADISYQAWKRGWRCLFAARSHVIHKHRGTSRPKFGDEFVDMTIRRNQFLFVWKNVTDAALTLRHLIGLPQIHGSSMLQKSVHFELRSYLRAIIRLPIAVWRRLANSREYVRSDRDVLRFSK